MPLPKHYHADVRRIYRVAADTLQGRTRVERKRAFLGLLRTYFPHFGKADLESAFDVVRPMAMPRAATARADELARRHARRVVQLFGWYDGDGNGVVSPAEFERMLPGRSDLFEAIDANGDGSIDVCELLRHCAKHPDVLHELEEALQCEEAAAARRDERRREVLFRPSADARPSLAHVRPLDEQVERVRRSEYLVD